MIKFGTSGWRAIIADEFTFDNVRLVAAAIAGTLQGSGLASRGMAIGYDTRFGSERFADAAAQVLASCGIRCVVSDRAIPTPAVAHTVRHFGFGGAINITASHNPAEYNGLKFSTEKGAPAPPEVTREVERRISTPAPSSPLAPIETADFREPYLEQLDRLVRFDVIKSSGIRLGLDPRWGAGRGWYDEALRRHGIPVVVIHDTRDVTYGGAGPDVSERTLQPLARLVTEERLTLGLACDGDADRFGVVDADGTWISPNTLLALLADYLASSRGFRQGLGRSYATTGLIDAVARHYGIAVHQTPVGFKYLGEQILDGTVYLAGEESAGMSMVGHVPEKDGLLAGLLAAEMVAATGRSIAQLTQDLFAKVGALYSAREDFTVSEAQVSRLRARMASPPSALGGRPIAKTTVWDGLRLDFDDGAWLLMRPSGTEPVVRYYAEARSQTALAHLMTSGKNELIGGEAA